MVGIRFGNPIWKKKSSESINRPRKDVIETYPIRPKTSDHCCPSKSVTLLGPQIVHYLSLSSQKFDNLQHLFVVRISAQLGWQKALDASLFRCVNQGELHWDEIRPADIRNNRINTGWSGEWGKHWSKGGGGVVSFQDLDAWPVRLSVSFILSREPVGLKVLTGRQIWSLRGWVRRHWNSSMQGVYWQWRCQHNRCPKGEINPWPLILGQNIPLQSERSWCRTCQYGKSCNVWIVEESLGWGWTELTP